MASSDVDAPVVPPSPSPPPLVTSSVEGTLAMFGKDDPYAPAPPVSEALHAKIAGKMCTYARVRPPRDVASTGASGIEERRRYAEELTMVLTGRRKRPKKEKAKKEGEEEGRMVVAYDGKTGALVDAKSGRVSGGNNLAIPARRRAPPKVPQPTWHPPWKLASVVSGHLGWVRCIAFEPGNEWFATGSADRTIKIWDLAKCTAGAEGGLKLTLTGHINAIRGLAISPRTTYMFSAGEDKKVMCWDLEMNKVVRHYHGHLSGCYSLAVHPTLDLLVTGGRDSCARVWDIRTEKQCCLLGGHTNTVGALGCNAVDPQVITGSYDCTVRLWDLAAGKSYCTLTHHKKAIRDLVVAPFEFSFVTGAADNLKKWQCKDGTFLKNFVGHKSIVNSLAVNDDGVLLSGGDDGTMKFWDYKTGYNFQTLESAVQPGSLECENAIYAAQFDLTGSRLVTGQADKTLKIFKEDLEATEDSHPVDMSAWTTQCRQLRLSGRA